MNTTRESPVPTPDAALRSTVYSEYVVDEIVNVSTIVIELGVPAESATPT